MTDDLRWAVRYAFLEDLWRDRARVIVDAGLEAALQGAGGQGTPGSSLDPLLVDLVDALVPRRPRDRTWVGVTDDGVARSLAQTRPGTGFLPRLGVAEVVAHRDWAVAMVELAALDEEAPGGARLREELAARAEEGRAVIVSTAVRAPEDREDDDEDPDYAALAECLDDFGGGRIYGMTRPGMAAMIDFGGDEDEDEDDEVPLTFDNTLGSQTPRFVEYVGIAGEVDELPEGMTLVELPEPSELGEEADVASAVETPDTESRTQPMVTRASGPASWATDESLRAQLAQAQRQVELATIDRQALLEKVDELESARAELEQQAVELRDHLARAVTEAPPEASEAADRLQAALADNQGLRWSVRQLEQELEVARARPVEALEAEVAALRARLAAAGSASPEVDAPTLIVRRSTPAVSETATTLVLDELETALADAEADEAEADAISQAKTAVQLDRDDTDGGGPEAGDAPEATPAARPEASAVQTRDEAAAVSETAATIVLGELQTVLTETDESIMLDPGASFEPLPEAIAAAERRRFGSALRHLDRLVERVERGGIGALQLRQALVSLRRRLRG